MASIQVYTSDKSAEIEAEAVVNGAVQGDGTILFTQNDGTALPGNPVIGPKGPTGAQGLDSNPLGDTTSSGEVRFATDAEAVAGTSEAGAVTPSNVLSRLKDIPVAKVFLTSISTAIPASSPVPYNTVAFDTHNMWDPTNHWFTIPRAGFWQIFAIFRTSAATATLYLEIVVNGTQRVNGSYFASQTMLTAHVAHVGPFNAGDTVQIRMGTAAATSYAAAGNYSWVDINYIDPLS